MQICLCWIPLCPLFDLCRSTHHWRAKGGRRLKHIFQVFLLISRWVFSSKTLTSAWAVQFSVPIFPFSLAFGGAGFRCNELVWEVEYAHATWSELCKWIPAKDKAADSGCEISLLSFFFSWRVGKEWGLVGGGRKGQGRFSNCLFCQGKPVSLKNNGDKHTHNSYKQPICVHSHTSLFFYHHTCQTLGSLPVLRSG